MGRAVNGVGMEENTHTHTLTHSLTHSHAHTRTRTHSHTHTLTSLFSLHPISACRGRAGVANDVNFAFSG